MKHSTFFLRICLVELIHLAALSLSTAQPQWNHLGHGLYPSVNAIELNGTDVYVGGGFTNEGGNSAVDFIARWDGCQWHALDSGLNSTVLSIAIVGSDIYVGGRFTLPYPYLLRWDGTQWNPVGSGPPGPVYDIVADGSNIIVGGGTQIEGTSQFSGFASQWDGNTWKQLGADLDGRVFALVVKGDDLYIGGGFDDADGNPDADAVARWDGTTWQSLGSGLQGGIEDFLIFNDELYASGSFRLAGGNPDPDFDHVTKWDGNTWINLGTLPDSDYGYNSLCAFQGSIYTVYGAGWDNHNGIYRWDFISGVWEKFQSAYLGADDGLLSLASDDENLYVGSAAFMGLGIEDFACIARWGEKEDCTTALEKESVNHPNEIRVYPNPIHDIMHFSIGDDEFQTYSVTLTNLTGKVIMKKRTNEQQLNIAHLPAGLYFLQIQANEWIGTAKIMKYE